MKVNLFTIEKEFAPEAMEEAAGLLRQTRDFRLTESDRNQYLFTSSAPDYQVEVAVRTGGQATAKCDCHFFRRHGACKHALAACIAVRDLRQKKKTKPRTDPNARLLEDVMKKMTRDELKSLVLEYASTHESFRLDLLATYLHRLPNPDYTALLASAAHKDKYGKLALNRKTVKMLRSVVSMLLQQIQDSLHQQNPDSALTLLESLMPFLYKVSGQDPKFRDTFQGDLKTALKWFEAVFRLPMAPRLLARGTSLAIELAARDAYYVPGGTRPLTEMAMPFILEAPDRIRAIEIAYDRLSAGKDDPLLWAVALVRFLRTWPGHQGNLAWPGPLAPWLPEVIRICAQAGDHADALTAWELAHPEAYPDHRLRPMLEAVWMSERATGDTAGARETAAYLVSAYFRTDALDWLIDQSPDGALAILGALEESHPAGQQAEADLLLSRGFAALGQPERAWARIRETNDPDVVRQVEEDLLPGLAEELTEWYAGYVRRMRATYGGAIARQKLNYIFGHLKATGRYESVRQKLNQPVQTANEQSGEQPIRGFVFDLDGVIVDTAVHHFDAWRSIMHQLGAEIQEEDDRHTRGASRMESFNYLLDRYGITLTETEKETWAARKNERYLEAIARITPADLLPGALDFITASRQAGLRLSLGSASRNARGVLDRLGIADMFDAIIDGNDVTHSKPDPEVFTRACAALSLPPEEVVVFEDAAKGIQAAIAAGCHAVGIGDPEILQEADIIIAGLHEATPAQILERIV